MSIHPTAVVAPGAQIDETTEIGPYCVIGEHVKIGPNNKLVAYVYIDGYVEIGAGNKIYPNCSIGTPPQDIGWSEGMVTYVKIGDENIIRENVTIHCGTEGSEENATTTVGSHNYLMANTHIAHDCTVGNYVTMVSFSGCPGHTQLFDRCIISGLSGMHQFCRIGRYAMISGSSVINKDLPPFMIADGRNGSVRAIN
ncbi:acyl-ACP--UDP-N-acetylglucosamine O-acyltransferase, partial [bacterium]|nr:acyl-ACP--UDP-N-acetylglucosamine O-acyltransferase [bacterium]